jgi:hypothetical protein
MRSYFENSAEEFYLYKIIFTPIKLLTSLYQYNILPAYLMSIKLWWNLIKTGVRNETRNEILDREMPRSRCVSLGLFSLLNNQSGYEKFHLLFTDFRHWLKCQLKSAAVWNRVHMTTNPRWPENSTQKRMYVWQNILLVVHLVRTCRSLHMV